MERLALGRATFVGVLVATISLTGRLSFSETTECRANPGAPAPQGMHWYYRVDRTNDRHCWYLHSAGMEVRSHENAPISKPRPQIVAEQPLASPEKDTLQTSPLQLATAENVLTETPLHDPPIGERAVANFTGRWLDLPPSVDLDDDEFAASRSDYIAEHMSSDSEEPMSSTSAVAPATTAVELPHKSTNAANFGSIFFAAALSVVLIGGALKLTRVFYNFVSTPRLTSELADDAVISLSELMGVLRRVDETLKAPGRSAPSASQATELIADHRTSNRDHLGPRAHSALPRLSRGHAAV
jgi:hypothetical protein